MKFSSILFFSLLFITTITNSQTDKGNWSAGIASTFSPVGNNSVLGFGYTTRKFDDNINSSEVFQFNFTPRLGYFLKNNLLVALDVNVSFSDNDGSQNTFFGGGPAIRYFFKGTRLKPFVELNSGYGNFNVKSADAFFGNQDFDVGYLLLGSAAGIAFPLKNILTIDLALAYNHQIGNFKQDDIVVREHNIGLKVGVTIFLIRKNTN